MAKAKLDPAFMAAPYYGDSSYDPIEAVKAVKLSEHQGAAARQKKQADDMDKGLEKISLDIKGWDEEQGFEEISGELESLRSQYIDLGTQGLNLAKPSNRAEQKIAKAINSRMSEIKNKHDVWQEQKQRVDEATKIIQSQLQKPEDERDIDTEATYEAIRQWKETPGGILDRSKGLDSLIVGKARPVDVGKYFQDTIPKYVPGTDKWVKSWEYDQTTGKFIKETAEGVDPKRAKEGILKAYKNAKPNIKNAVDRMFQEDPERGVLNKEEWLVKTFGPEYPEKVDKTAGGGSGSLGLSVGFGIPEKGPDGMYPVQSQIRDIYFSSNSTGSDKMYQYESIGRVPIGAIFGFKPITMMGSINNTNTATGEKEAVGKAIAAVPVEMNMLPVATKDMQVTIKDPNTGEDVTETFKSGDRIPKHVQDYMRTANKEARDKGEPPTYMMEFRPYVTMGLKYQQVKEGQKLSGEMAQFSGWVDATGRTTSYTETSIVPYGEVKEDLRNAARENKQDFQPYDDYIQQMMAQLNGTDKINAVLENKAKSMEDLYNSLEGK